MFRVRRWPAAVAALVLGVSGMTLGATPALAASGTPTTSAFGGTGTFTNAGTVYAKSGVSITLTVNTDSGAKCVEITGAHTALRTTGSTPFTFTFTTNAGSGIQQVGIATGTGNKDTKCTGNGDNTSAAYTLDNTPPTVTGTRSPAANNAGWNKSDVAIAWVATDAGGSGVASGPTPANATVTTNGAGTVRTATAIDNLGNTGSGTVTVNLDKNAPTVSGTPTPAPNTNGWNNTDVTVAWSCADTGGSGVTGSCPSASTLSSNAANQSASSGTVSDLAGNTASGSVTGVNIDKVAPTLSGVPSTTGRNTAGWYRNDVSVGWIASDALSGATNPASSTITGEGATLTASASVTDAAGNSSGSVVSAPAVKIDRTAPVTTVTAPPAWNKTDVTLALVPNDGLSGVDKTFYILDGSATQVGASVPVTAQGNHTLQFWSTDVAGNIEGTHTVSFGIDKSSPTIGHTQSPVANANGWNSSAVTVTFSCSDALSGVATCTGSQTVSTQGLSLLVTGAVTDNAGNTAVDPARVSIDTTKPVIIVDPFAGPNAAGWYGNDVTVTYSCTDALSGIQACDAGHTFGPGANQTDTGTATDAAGNSASATTQVINVDTIAPTILGAVVGTPNANGWFSGDVTVHWTCADNLSGVVACPADTVVSGEGGDLSAARSVSDKAGHSATATVGGIKIDRTKPGTTATGVPGGWVPAAVSIGLHGVDNLSDIDSTYYAVDGATTPTKGNTVTIGVQGVHTVSYWSVDNAGNTEAAQTFTVKIDLSSPTINPSQSPVRNTNGWNNTDVTVSFTCADQALLSGLASCENPKTVTDEGAAQAVTGIATDIAGNSTSATATVNLDKTAPTITGEPDRAANAAGWYKDDVTVTFVGADPLSGLATVTDPQHLTEGAVQSASGTATDNAGNSSSATVGPINVDKTKPNLSAAPTSGPNTNGWYNSDVTQVWAADDSMSGLATAVPDNSVLSTEGEGLTAAASVTDKAGNVADATSEPVKIDKTAPNTGVSAPSGWVNSSVDVTLTPHDALSGIDATHYTVDGGAAQVGTTIPLTSQGTHTISYGSTDKAGNVEATRIVTVKIDKSDPTIGHTQAPVTNLNGWNNSDVTVTFICADQTDLSGIATCTTPQTVTTEGKDQAVTGTATDNAGNTATDPATVSIDKTKPTITGSRSPAANSLDWNNSDVTVHFTGQDEAGGSGLDTVTSDKTFGEGTGQSLEGTVVDAAGNSAGTMVDGINVDKIAPTLSGAPTTAANGNGWYNSDVTIKWTADDNRSGVVSTPTNSTITGESAGLKYTATVTDKADNSTTADSAAVNIDRTAPTTGANAPAGWNNSSVTISLTPADGLSGLDATYYKVDDGTQHEATALTIDTEGVHTLTYWSVDFAGNIEPAQSVTVKIDLTKPTITHTVTPAPNEAGWNTSPVAVAFDCKDALSGTASCSPDAHVTTDGASQAVLGTAVDKADNTQTDNVKVSIDTVKPTITGAPDRSANTHNWYAGDVTVRFTCDDVLSGIAGCASPATLGEGKAQSAKGSATDTAGNTDDFTVGPINVDKTAPTLSGAPTTSPNAAGWYKNDVTVKWTAGDALSEIDGAGPADSVIGGEGTGLTTGASVDDLAGNQTSASSTPIKIDRTAPTTTVSDVSGWTNNDVTVTLSAGDNLSGVAVTHYQLDQHEVGNGTSVIVGGEGIHTLQVWSVDVAGNVEAQKNLEVKIDKTAPGITHIQAPLANSHSWNNSDVTVTFTCTDTGSATANSGIDSCTGSRTVASQGWNQPVVGEAKDKAGNSATDPTSVSIDKTGPTVSGILSADANANGWFRSDVTATFTCADQFGLSGILSCPAAKTLGEGYGQSAGGTATDAAGNVSDPFSLTWINVDKTNPTLSGATTTAPNGKGWYKGDVAVTWTAADLLSGIDGATPANTTITGEGDNLSAGASVTDKAGNTVGSTVNGIKIDRHYPNTSAHALSGWQKTDVTVTLTAVDNLSGVEGTHYSVDGGAPESGITLTVSTDGSHQVAFWSEDNAGNGEPPNTITVMVDKSAPTITGAATTSPNANGWYAAPVIVHFTCTDQAGLSGIASCQPPAVLAAEGANSVTGTAVDNAGNTGTATVSGIRIDTVKPAVTIGGVTDGASYVLGAAPTPTCSASDATSLVAGLCSGTKTGGTTNGVGTFTYTATAIDKAGNVGTASATYQVRYGYGTTLFLQPVNDTAHQTGVATSVFNAGQTIPMKFQLQNASGQLVQALSAPKWLTPVKGGSTAAAVNETAYSVSATTGTTYTWDGTQYQYNWKTDKSQAGYYWRVGVTLDDGQTYYVNIGLK